MRSLKTSSHHNLLNRQYSGESIFLMQCLYSSQLRASLSEQVDSAHQKWKVFQKYMHIKLSFGQVVMYIRGKNTWASCNKCVGAEVGSSGLKWFQCRAPAVNTCSSHMSQLRWQQKKLKLRNFG